MHYLLILLLIVGNVLGGCIIRIHLAMTEAARLDNLYTR